MKRLQGRKVIIEPQPVSVEAFLNSSISRVVYELADNYFDGDYDRAILTYAKWTADVTWKAK